MSTQETASPMERRDGQNRRLCSAHRTNGEECRAPAMRGQRVCRKHGGGTPQARRAARLRLADLIDVSVTTLARVITNPNAKDADRIRAAEAVLDRTGQPRGVKVEAISSEEAKRQLLKALLRMREQAIEQDRMTPPEMPTSEPESQLSLRRTPRESEHLHPADPPAAEAAPLGQEQRALEQREPAAEQP